MNVVVPLSKDDPSSFWIVVVGIVVLALFVVAVAWRSHWIRLPRRAHAAPPRSSRRPG
jgi:uncharacterized protein (DUF983 family)